MCRRAERRLARGAGAQAVPLTRLAGVRARQIPGPCCLTGLPRLWPEPYPGTSNPSAQPSAEAPPTAAPKPFNVQVNALITRARGFRSATALINMITFVHGGLCPDSPYGMSHQPKPESQGESGSVTPTPVESVLCQSAETPHHGLDDHQTGSLCSSHGSAKSKYEPGWHPHQKRSGISDLLTLTSLNLAVDWRYVSSSSCAESGSEQGPFLTCLTGKIPARAPVGLGSDNSTYGTCTPRESRNLRFSGF